MASILEAPCPFLAGMTNIAPLKKIDKPDDLIVINLEVQSQDLPENPVLPDLPNQNRLLETLSYFYPKTQGQRRSKKVYLDHDSTHPLIVQINSYIASLLLIEKHCITDLTRDVTVFWADNFLEEQTEENLPFYKHFVTTQMFQNYTDKYLREYDRKRRLESPKKEMIILRSAYKRMENRENLPPETPYRSSVEGKFPKEENGGLGITPRHQTPRVDLNSRSSESLRAEDTPFRKSG